MARYSTINTCDSLTSWSLDTNGVGTGSLDTTVKTQGAASLKYVRTVDKARNLSQTLRFTMPSASSIMHKVLTFSYRWDTPQNKLSVRFIDASGTTIGSTAVSVDVAADTWHTARVPLHGIELTAINRIDFFNDGDAYAGWQDGQTVTLWIDDIKLEWAGRRQVRKPFVVFEFDDGYEDTYTDAFPLFAAYGHVAVVGVITSAIGGVYPGDNTPMLSAAQLTELKAAGWEIASHTRDHTNMMLANAATITAQMTGSIADLAALGINATHFIYPFTQHSAESVAQSQLYFASASNGTPPRQNLKVGETYTLAADTARIGKANRYLLVRQPVTPAVSAETVKRWIDDALAYGTLLIINLHEVNAGENGSSGAQWASSKLESVLRYLNERGIETKTTTQAISAFGL